MSDASTRGIFEAVIVTSLCGQGDETLSDAELVDALAALEPRFATVEDRLELAGKMRAQLEREGIEDALAHIAPAIAEKDRSLAFSLCVRVMMADGKTDGDEAMVLGTLQELFELSAATVQKHLDEEKARRTP